MKQYVLCKTGLNQSGTSFNQLKRQDKRVTDRQFLLIIAS